MKRINEQTEKIYNNLYLNTKQRELLDLRQSEIESNRKAKQYKNKAETSRVLDPTFYRFKMVIWFKNNPKPVWLPSLDFYKGPAGNYIDEWKGLTKLKRRIKHDYFNKYKTAIIYMSINKKPTTKSYSHNLPVDFWHENEQREYFKGGKKLVRISFINIGQNNFVNLESENLKNEVIRYSK